MGVAKFIKGTVVEIDNRPYTLKKFLSNSFWQVEDNRNGRISEISKAELEKLYVENRLIFINRDDYSDDENKALALSKRDEVKRIQIDSEKMRELQKKKAYISAVEGLPISKSLIVPAIHQVWGNLKVPGTEPNWVTVTRWLKRYLNTGKDAFALLDDNHSKGNRTRRYPISVLHIVDDVVDQIYLTPERRTVEETLTHAIVVVERENRQRPMEMQLPLPTRRLVQASINNIEAYDRYAARYSQLSATRKFRSTLHMNVTDHPLECAEIDHTLLDLMVVDEATGMPFGRPWLTVCIERYTRCVLGINLGFEPPSYLTVARCLKHAFLPKVGLQEQYPEIKNAWLAHGVMSKLIVDNGLEFHGLGLEAVCLSLGIDLQFTPRKTPWWKGAVERFIGTLNRNVAHGVPGTTFSNIFDKADYDPVKNAVISLNKLNLILNKWIVDSYHQAPHRSLDRISPELKWTSSIQPEDISLPDNPARLDAILGKAEQRTVTHKGIQYLGLYYNSSELAGLRRRIGDTFKVEIRVDAGNLGHIHMISPDNKEIMRIPCLDLEYADDLTSWQHDLCQRYARERLQKLGNTSNAWRHAKVEIYELVQVEIGGRKKKKLHAKAARFVEANKPLKSVMPSTNDAPQQLEIITIDGVITTPLATVPTTPVLSDAPVNVPAKLFSPIITSRQVD